MDTYSSVESSKPHSTNKAYVLNELKEAKRALALRDEAMQKLEERLEIKDEAMQKLEERLAKVELKQEKCSHSIHGRHHSPRNSSKKVLLMLTTMGTNIEEGAITIILMEIVITVTKDITKKPSLNLLL